MGDQWLLLTVAGVVTAPVLVALCGALWFGVVRRGGYNLQAIYAAREAALEAAPQPEPPEPPS
jgi:hypothetical protein